jgi:predicted GNAT family N-acyltransferase
MMDSHADAKIEIVDGAQAGLLEQAYRLRYQVSVEEMHKTLAVADDARREIRDDLDDDRSTVLCAVADGEVIATMRLTWGAQDLPAVYHQQFSLARFADFPLDAISFTSRLVVHKNWRGSAALGLLFNHGYELSRQRGSRINFCHCAPALVRLYEQVGFRRYADAIVDPEVGYHIPLLMLTEDAEHLKRVRSPLLRVARRFDNPRDSADWFDARFPDYAAGGAHAASDPERFLHTLAEQLFDTEIALFRGLSLSDAERFIQASTVLHCKAGDHIVRRGDVGNEMFLILSGAAEVRCGGGEGDGRSATIATLGRGQTFGEMAFLSSQPRSASIVAITDMQVLVLSQRLFQKLMKSMPDTVIQILLNLSVVLCDRLNLSNEQLLAYRAGEAA